MSKNKMMRGGGFGGRPMGLPGAGAGGAGGGGMNNLLSQMQKLQKEMEKTQADLATQEISASSGGGMVTVVVTGDQQLKSLIIKPEAVSPDDVELLQDMVLAAVNEAMQKAKEMEQSKLGGLTGGLGLPGF